MVLNYIWIAFFLIAFIVGLAKLILLNDTTVFPAMVTATFDMAKTAVMDIALPLTGVMTLWLGLMNVGEKAGAIGFLARIVGPFFNRLFPEIPKNHPAGGNIIMNFSANMLGLDNAATPLGLKAMQSLQELNPAKETASNAQIMFLVLNTSGLTLIPITIMAQRAVLGAANPTDVFIPILLATYCSTLGGLIAVSIWQRINLFHPVVLAWLIGITAVVAGLGWYFSSLGPAELEEQSKTVSTIIILSIIVAFLLGAMRKRVNAFDAFIEGAKGGFETSVKIIPYLVAMLVGIAVFRASGAMDYLIAGIIALIGIPREVADSLPTAFMKPLSGSGARGMMIDAMNTHGADSFAGRLSCIFQGAADTTFYIIALYFGSVGIRKTRYAIAGGLIADLCGVIAAIFIAYMFFGSSPAPQARKDAKVIMTSVKRFAEDKGTPGHTRVHIALQSEMTSDSLKFHRLWMGDTAIAVKALPAAAMKGGSSTAYAGGDTIYLVSAGGKTISPLVMNDAGYHKAISSKALHFHRPVYYEGVALIEYSVKGKRKYLVIEKW